MENAARMQRLRARRYASVFKACHDLTYEVTDMLRVFYQPSVNHFVGPQLRRDLILHCYSDCFRDAGLITERIKGHDLKTAILCYLVILEANDNRFTVQERFEKHILDAVYDATCAFLIGSGRKGLRASQNSTI